MKIICLWMSNLTELQKSWISLWGWFLFSLVLDHITSWGPFQSNLLYDLMNNFPPQDAELSFLMMVLLANICQCMGFKSTMLQSGRSSFKHTCQLMINSVSSGVANWHWYHRINHTAFSKNAISTLFSAPKNYCIRHMQLFKTSYKEILIGIYRKAYTWDY